MQGLPLPSAARGAPAAAGGGRHRGGLPHAGHQPLTAGQGDTTLGRDHRKLPFRLLLVYMLACILIPLHDPRLISYKLLLSTFTCMSVAAHMSLADRPEEITGIFFYTLAEHTLSGMNPNLIPAGPISPSTFLI